MIIWIQLRLMRLAQVLLPRRAFLATYEPSNEAERKQSEVERNRIRRMVWIAKRVDFINKQ